LALVLFAFSRLMPRGGFLFGSETRPDRRAAAMSSNVGAVVAARIQNSGTSALGTAGYTQITDASKAPADAPGRQNTNPGRGRVDATPDNSAPGGLRCIAANAVASETEMLFAIVRLDDAAASVIQQAMVPGNMRLPEAFVPEPGIYVRVLASSGELLAQASQPDPRRVYHDEPVPGGDGLLRGGVVMLPSAEFNVRFPRIAGMDRVELFLIGETTEVRNLTSQSKEFRGSFKITSTAR